MAPVSTISSLLDVGAHISDPKRKIGVITGVIIPSYDFICSVSLVLVVFVFKTARCIFVPLLQRLHPTFCGHPLPYSYSNSRNSVLSCKYPLSCSINISHDEYVFLFSSARTDTFQSHGLYSSEDCPKWPPQDCNTCKSISSTRRPDFITH